MRRLRQLPAGTADPRVAAPGFRRRSTRPRGREVILKVLSGVARAKGRFGKIAVAQMLTGSDSERMARWKLDQLSTYGILRDSGFTQKDVSDIIDALSKARLVETQEVDRFKPVINLTEAGWSWLRTQEPAELILDLPAELVQRIRRGGLTRPVREAVAAPPPRPSITRPAPSQEAPPEPEEEPGSESAADLTGDPLWERLKALRSDWARELKQPAYCIFTNQTLEALVRERPATPAALANIKGLGRARIERHGAALLEAIAAYPQAAPAAPPSVAPPAPARPRAEVASAAPASPTPAPPSAPLPRTGEPGDHFEACLDRGMDLAAGGPGLHIDEAAAIRGLEPAAIIRHLTWMVKRGHQLPVESFLVLGARLGMGLLACCPRRCRPARRTGRRGRALAAVRGLQGGAEMRLTRVVTRAYQDSGPTGLKTGRVRSRICNHPGPRSGAPFRSCSFALGLARFAERSVLAMLRIKPEASTARKTAAGAPRARSIKQWSSSNRLGGGVMPACLARASRAVPRSAPGSMISSTPPAVDVEELRPGEGQRPD